LALKRRRFTREFTLQVVRELEAGKTPAQAAMAQTDFRSQPLKAVAPLGTGARSAEIVVNHQHPGFGPTPGDSPMHQAVLQLYGLPVLQYLLHRQLPYIYDGQPLQVPWEDFLGILLPRLNSVVQTHLPSNQTIHFVPLLRFVLPTLALSFSRI
jgi:hypothetical protein